MMMELKAGAKIGRYELLTHMARGGMADVWLARASGPVGFQKTVVIKTILPHLADDPEFVRMFIDEAVIAAQLDHPNIVHIFDLGEIEGSYFIAMEYIAGRSLRNVQRELHRSKRVPPPWFVLRSVSSACEALHHVHNKRDEHGKPLHLVHRDVSPENIMVSFTGETKVLDFGIAKVSTAASKTRVGVVKGKYAYMAPEQIETAGDGTPLDGRIDIYALGVVLYELLTGRRPFRGANDLALLRQILSGNPEPPSSFCNWIPEPLSQLVLKAMARAPSGRFSTAGELQQAIEDFLASQGFHPTHLHVAAFMRSVFGDDAVDALPIRPAGGIPSDDKPVAAVPTPTPEEGKEESIAIDVSVLLEDEELEAVEVERKPAPPPPPAAPRASPLAAPVAIKSPPGRVSAQAARSSPQRPSTSSPAHKEPSPRVVPASSASSASANAATSLPAQSRSPDKRSSKRPPRSKAPPASSSAATPASSSLVAPRASFSVIASRAAGVSAASQAAGQPAQSQAVAAPVAKLAAVSPVASHPKASTDVPAHGTGSTDIGDHSTPAAAGGFSSFVTSPPAVDPRATTPSTDSSSGVARPKHASTESSPSSVAEAAEPVRLAQVVRPEEDAHPKGGQPTADSDARPSVALAGQGSEARPANESAEGPTPASDTGRHVWDRLMQRVREQKVAESAEGIIEPGEAVSARPEEQEIRTPDSASSEVHSERALSAVRPSSVSNGKPPSALGGQSGGASDPSGQGRAGAGVTRAQETDADFGAKSDSGPKHVWDVLLERARDERETGEKEIPHAMADGGPESPASERSAVGVRPVSSADLSEHQPVEVRGFDLNAGRARQAFEKGLERLRKKDLDGALEQWSRAVELEPDNRAYQSNVRMLKKQVAQRK